MLTRLQKLVDEILIEEELTSFQSEDDIIKEIFDSKFENNFEKFSGDKNLIKKIKRVDSELLEKAILKIYDEKIEKADENDSLAKKYANCVFNFLKELQENNEKVI